MSSAKALLCMLPARGKQRLGAAEAFSAIIDFILVSTVWIIEVESVSSFVIISFVRPPWYYRKYNVRHSFFSRPGFV
jgi:hypothetical protein